MNKYYTKIPDERRVELHRLRGAHNLWYVYARHEKAGLVRDSLRSQVDGESAIHGYDFEVVLDECGYGYLQKLENPAAPEPLWQVHFSKI
jgi:hypothetical protein